jgi:hypothetical protein
LKDQRYKAIKSLIESNAIQHFLDIFTIIPISTVRVDLKINYNTLRNRVHKVELLTVKDITGMARLFDVEPALLFKIILVDIKSTPASKRRLK